MDILHFLIDLVLHVDQHLATFVQHYGVWVYALLFAIIFIETGVVVMPFLPGDSLLFVVGAMCAVGVLSLPVSLALLFAAAVSGNHSNYSIGYWLGPKVFQWERSRWFNKDAFNKAHEFFERYGGVTLVLARFVPFLRTFAPFVAGVTRMSRAHFLLFDLVGGGLWVCGVVLAGYFFGNIPWVKDNLDKIIWAMILIPGVLALLGAWRSGRRHGLASR